MSIHHDESTRSQVAVWFTTEAVRRAFQAIDVLWTANQALDALWAELVYPEAPAYGEPDRPPYVGIYCGPVFVCLVRTGDALPTMVATIRRALEDLDGPTTPFVSSN